MKPILSRLSSRILISLAPCILLLSLASIVYPQASRTLSTTGRRLDEFNKQNEKVARDELEGEMRGRKPTSEERRLAEARKAQIKEDFEILQASYNDIVTRLRANEQLTSAYVSEVTGKIAKSSHRLRGNIGFPEKKQDAGKTDERVTQRSRSMKDLCIQLLGFLTSPMFETGVLDLIEAEKARDTLDQIILTTEAIRHNNGKSN